MTEIQTITLSDDSTGKLVGTDDPVALATSWQPLEDRSGADHKTHKLKASEGQISVQKTVGGILFSVAFLIAGLLVISVWVLVMLYKNDIQNMIVMIVPFVIGSIFIVVGVLMLTSSELTFHKPSGMYFKGKRHDSTKPPKRNKQGRLADIHALQLITEQITEQITSPRKRKHRGGVTVGTGDLGTYRIGSGNKYYQQEYDDYLSYELNLIFKDGQRLNVMDHGDEAAIDNAAQQLGEFLEVPVWKSNRVWNMSRRLAAESASI